MHDTRNSLTEVNRRYHELELDYKRIENEREELAAAYKEAEAVSIHFVIPISKVSAIFAKETHGNGNYFLGP